MKYENARLVRAESYSYTNDDLVNNFIITAHYNNDGNEMTFNVQFSSGNTNTIYFKLYNGKIIEERHSFYPYDDKLLIKHHYNQAGNLVRTEYYQTDNEDIVDYAYEYEYDDKINVYRNVRYFFGTTTDLSFNNVISTTLVRYGSNGQVIDRRLSKTYRYIYNDYDIPMACIVSSHDYPTLANIILYSYITL